MWQGHFRARGGEECPFLTVGKVLKGDYNISKVLCEKSVLVHFGAILSNSACLLYTSDAADE